MGSWYIARHGETEWNRTGRIQGHSDVPLNERGRLQVRMLAKRLAGYGFSAVYTSDLSRGIESSQAIIEGSGTSIETDSDLREFSYGEWEGLTLEEAETRDPTDFAKRMGLGYNAFAAPGGEDTAKILERVRRFYMKAVKRHSDADDLLIVAHGGPIRALLVCLLGLTDDHFWRFRVDCAGLSVVNSQPNGHILERWNDTSHLTSIV